MHGPACIFWANLRPVSIEDIGVALEEPFMSLSMWRYCEAIDQLCDRGQEFAAEERRRLANPSGEKLL
jgi:hypothetical protein